MKSVCFAVLFIVVVAAATSAARVARSVPGANSGNGFGYGFENEYNYRGYGAYPIHLGNGHFHYMGGFNGNCADAVNSGFYFAGDVRSFVMCDHGVSYKFDCPLGTANREASYFDGKHAYGIHEFCSVNINQ